jgi:GTPase KRas protein
VPEYEPTIEDSFRTQLNIDSQLYDMTLLDTAGDRQYIDLRKRSISVHNTFVLVYSIASRDSFDEAAEIYQEILAAHPSTRHRSMVLVGNQSDITNRQVSLADGQWRAREWGCQFVETSAKDHRTVLGLFRTLVIQTRRKDQPAMTPVAATIPTALTVRKRGSVQRLAKKFGINLDD